MIIPSTYYEMLSGVNAVFIANGLTPITTLLGV